MPPIEKERAPDGGLEVSVSLENMLCSVDTQNSPGGMASSNTRLQGQ